MISNFISKPPKAIRDFFEHAGQSKLSPRRAELRARLQATASRLTNTQLALAVDPPALLRHVNAGFTDAGGGPAKYATRFLRAKPARRRQPGDRASGGAAAP
jgi:hypothetical protein